MKLDLTKEQFKSLLMTVCYATECMDDAEPNSFVDGALATFDLLQDKAEEAGLKKGKDLQQDEEGQPILHANFVKNYPGFMDSFDDHREDVFWSELLARMVGNTMRRKFGAKFDAQSIPQKEQDKIWERMEIELAENGLDNIFIKGEQG
jgi:hypothetical protein